MTELAKLKYKESKMLKESLMSIIEKYAMVSDGEILAVFDIAMCDLDVCTNLNFGNYVYLQTQVVAIAMHNQISNQENYNGSIFENELHKSFERDNLLVESLGVDEKKYNNFMEYLMDNKLDLIETYAK